MIYARIEMMLKEYPLLLGSGTSIGGAFLSTMEALDPYMRFLALLVGLLIGIITVMIKFKEWKIRQLEHTEISARVEVTHVHEYPDEEAPSQ